MKITIHRAGQNSGPYTIEQVRQMLVTNQIQLTDLAHYTGLAQWIKVSEIPQLQPPVAAALPPMLDRATPQATPPRQADSRSDFEYSIEGRPDFSFLNVTIPGNQTLKVESSSMATMDTNLVMKTKMRGGMSRFLTGESLFINEFTAQGGSGKIGIAPGSPGDLEHVYLDGDTVYLQNSAFVASSMSVTVESKWQGLIKGLFSGESLFLIRCSGKGDLWFNTFGAIIPIDVNGHYIVDTGHIVGFTEGLQYEIGRIGGYKSFFLSGEGLVCQFSGRGRLWIQTRKLPWFAGWTFPFRPRKNND